MSEKHTPFPFKVSQDHHMRGDRGVSTGARLTFNGPSFFAEKSRSLSASLCINIVRFLNCDPIRVPSTRCDRILLQLLHVLMHRYGGTIAVRMFGRPDDDEQRTPMLGKKRYNVCVGALLARHSAPCDCANN
jgi:hypothetical protein